MSSAPTVTLPVHGKSGPASDGFWDTPLNDLLQQLQATPAGLTSVEAKRRLDLYGPNSLERESRFGVLLSFVRSFANPLILILMAASAISLTVGDPVGGLIIIAMVLLSVLLNFFMEFQARHAVEEIQKQVASTAAVVRDGQEHELPVAELVQGDIVRLNAGDLVPADARLLDEKDLQVRESASPGSPCRLRRRRMICRRASMVSLTQLTASSWAPRFRRGWARRSSSRPARIPSGEKSPPGWRRSLRTPSSAAASATSE